MPAGSIFFALSRTPFVTNNVSHCVKETMDMNPHHQPSIEQCPVLIVGGGLAGLSAALFLAARRVPTVLVERHAASSPHPRAIGVTTRSLELLRPLELAPPIPE